MNKGQYTGWQDVFSFSFVQSMKSKSNRIAIGVMCIVLILSMPVMSLISGKGSKREAQDFVKTLKVYGADQGLWEMTDRENWMNGFQDWLLEQPHYKNIAVELVETEEAAKELEKDLEESKDKVLLMKIGMKDGMLQLQYVYSKESGIKTTEIGTFADDVQDSFQEICEKSEGLTDEQLKLLQTPVKTEIQSNVKYSGGEQEKENTSGIGMEDYNILLALLMVSVLMSSIMGESVASSIITEKSSKVIEYLMTSIRPMAIILGKVGAAVAVVLVQLCCYIVSGGISVVLDSVIFYSNDGGFQVSDNVAKVLEMPSLQHLSASRIGIALIAILLGVSMYGVIASIFASGVSKIEEMAEGMKFYNVLLILCAYATIGITLVALAGEKDVSILQVVLSLFPLSAPFMVPGYIMIGKISLLIGALSLVVQIATIFLILKLVSGIYEMVIYHQGNTMQWKDFVSLWKLNRKGEK